MRFSLSLSIKSGRFEYDPMDIGGHCEEFIERFEKKDQK